MTSGVKQALPQILMPKAGMEGKTARNRAPQADFAETLGMVKASGNLKADAKPDLLETDVHSPWPRLASKLDEAIGRTQEIALKSDIPNRLPKDKDDGSLDGKSDAGSGDADTTSDSALPGLARNAAEVAQAPVSAPALAFATETDVRPDVAPPSTEKPSADTRRQPIGADREIVIGKPAPAPARTGEAAFIPLGGEQAEPISLDPTTRPVSSPEQPSPRTKEALSDASSDTAKAAPRITVVAQQNIPAPTPSTALVLVESIAASDLLDLAGTRFSLDAIHPSATHASAQSLKIQLHPAELGMVTATLRFAGEQLSIELQVENHEAYRRLASDSETIVGSLRDLGYDVERVTVLQPSLAATPLARSDASASMPSPQGRPAEQFGSGTANGGSGGSGERSSGNGGNQGNSAQHRPPTHGENSGSGLFI